jgi:archaellum component FlaC
MVSNDSKELSDRLKCISDLMSIELYISELQEQIKKLRREKEYWKRNYKNLHSYGDECGMN